jgi:hypothetical protein
MQIAVEKDDVRLMQWNIRCSFKERNEVSGGKYEKSYEQRGQL